MTDFISRLKAISTGSNPDSRKSPHGASNGVPDNTHLQDGNGFVESAPPQVPRQLGRDPASPSVSRQKKISSPEPQQPDTQKSPRRRKPIYQRWWVWVILGISASVGGGAVSAYDAITRIKGELPDTANVLTFVRDGTLTIKAADGSVLQQLGPATREKLSFDQMPPLLIEAFIASEDQHFYEHDGVDYKAIVRAVVANISAGEVVEGGSTITQQVARIVFLDQDRSIDRKLREALLAQKIEAELTKEQILERYLNLVYLGSGAYGVADAAWVYFSKPVGDLTLSEMAMIAGMPPAPSAYSPLVNLEVARERRNIVLARMVETGFITQAEMEKAVSTPLALKPSTPRNLYSNTPYFTSYVQQQLPNYVSQEDLELGGLTVETTLNPKWQQQAQETVIHAIENYGPRQNFTQAALVAIDPRTGEIKALVGGNDFNKSQFNRATQALRQPGSTFKVFVYTAAIAGGFSPSKTYVDAKFVVDGYEPSNYGRGYRGNISIRDALISSVNIVAVKTLIDVGFDPVIDMAKRMGIQSELMPTYSLALGASEVNLLELTSAYGTLAYEGRHIEPHGIVRITNRYGEVLYEADFETKQAVDQDTAAIMTWMLRGVVEGGTGARAQLRGRQVAGKTGTSEERRDLWFIGYIPQVVTGVWLGNDNNRPTWGASSTAARTWNDFMSEIVGEIPEEDFPDLPRLQGRRATITLRPVKPRRVTSQNAASENENAENASSSEAENNTEREQQDHSEPVDSSPKGEGGGSEGEPVAPTVEVAPEAAPPEPAPEPAPEAAPPPMVVPVEPASEPAAPAAP
ncbi:MAG: penicillin-binding protein 1A [Oculatellaceae cyanobacterium bins.114]|nr:penicillin-binding protein 1A [Oculatellaceae cyanobacterium bins.114]